MTTRARPDADRPELALLGAFPFPYPQGSQVFMAEQARALARAGARPTLFTYGRGQGHSPTDLARVTAPRWSAPRAMRSGPHAGKPLADAALLAVYARVARRRFACALAHNAEAAYIALLARPVTKVPVIYVAHTILRHELSAYADTRWRPQLDRLGQGIDRTIARGADAVIALSDDAARALAPHARVPVSVIPPGHDAAPAPTPQQVGAVCARHGLCPDTFFLYAGNLDGYQDLDLLAATVRHLPADAPAIVVATHAAAESGALPAHDAARLRVVTVDDFEAVRALVHAARVLVVPRRRPGGFPVKLLNYMEAGRAIVAFRDVAVGLVDGESAALLAPGASAAALGQRLLALHRDDGLRERLGAGARSHLLAHHGWQDIAARTLDVVAAVRR